MEYILVNGIIKALDMVKVFRSGMMAQSMKATGMIIKLMVEGV